MIAKNGSAQSNKAVVLRLCYCNSVILNVFQTFPIILLSFFVISLDAFADNLDKSTSIHTTASTSSLKYNRSLTLESAINRALEYNRSLLGARDSLLSSQYSLASSKVDFELKITPSATAGVSGSDSGDTVENLGFGMALSKRLPWGTNISATPATQHSYDFYTSSVNMDFTQPLLRGIGREYTLSGVRSAEFAERSVRRSLYLTQINTVLGTVQSVYDVIRLGEDVRHNQASLDRLRLHLEGMRVKSKAGHTSSIDLYRAEFEVRNAQDALVESQEAYGDAVDSLKILLAFPLDEKIEVDAPLEFSAIDITDEEAIKVAVRNRVEIDQARDALGEAKRLSRVAGQNTWPQLDVVVHYGRSGAAGDFGPSLNLNEEIWSINLVSSTDLFRKTEKLAYKQSLLQIQGARRSFSLTKDQVVQEVKRERRNLMKGTEQIEIRKDRIHQAKGKLELAKVKYRWGKANNFDIIESEKELRQSQVSFVGAIVDYIVGTYRLRATLGTLLEREGV